MRTPLGLPFFFLVLPVTVWCVVLPFVWAYNTGHRIQVGYWEMLSLYIPELAVAGVVLACLPMVFLRHRLAVIGLLFAAVLAPALKLTIGSPTDNVWPVAVILLSLLSWRLHVRIAARA